LENSSGEKKDDVQRAKAILEMLEKKLGH